MDLSLTQLLSSDGDSSELSISEYNTSRRRELNYSEMSLEDFFGVYVDENIFDSKYINNIRSDSEGPKDGYQINKQIFITIEEDPKNKDNYYVVHEPKLFEKEEIFLGRIVNPVYQSLETKTSESFRSVEEKEEFIDEQVEENLKYHKFANDFIGYLRSLLGKQRVSVLDDQGLENIKYFIKRDKVHYDKITPLLKDSKIEDITCPKGEESPVYVYHEDYGYIMTNIAFEKEELDSFVRSLANRSNKTISKSDPMLDAALPDGSRLQATYQNEVSRGTTFTIRQSNDDQMNPVELLQYKTFNYEQMAFIWLAIEMEKGLFAAGGTGAGKTSTLNAVLDFKPPNKKVVSIEDTAELTLRENNWTNLTSRPGLTEKDEINFKDLLRGSLRMRPDLLVLGEVRDEVVQSVFEAMTTDHTAYSTFHAENMDTISTRLNKNGVSKDEQYPLDIVVFQDQMPGGKRRVRDLVEVRTYDEDEEKLITNSLWKWNEGKKSYTKKFDNWTDIKLINEILDRIGKQDDKETVISGAKGEEYIKNEIETRKEILKTLDEYDIDNSNTIMDIFTGLYNRKSSDVNRDYPYIEEISNQINNGNAEQVVADLMYEKQLEKHKELLDSKGDTV